MSTPEQRADAARNLIREGIAYLAEHDGYSRDDLQDFLNDAIEDTFADD